MKNLKEYSVSLWVTIVKGYRNTFIDKNDKSKDFLDDKILKRDEKGEGI